MIKREVDISEAKELGYAKDEPNQKTIVLYEYELEDIPKLLSGELTHFNGTQMNGDTGKTEWFRFTPEALEAWDKSKAADELMYWAEIEKKLNAKKNSFQNTLSKSIDPAELIADSIRKHQWRLTPSKDKNAPIELGLDPNGHLKAAYSRLMQGEREYRTGYWYYNQILADVEVKFLQWLKEKQDSTRTESTQSVRGNGIAPNELSPSEMILRHAEFDLRVERLKRERAELKAKPVADTSTATQESKGGTEAENKYKVVLTYNLNETERKELFAELMRYEKDSHSLTELLNGQPVVNRITVTCQQNEFAEVFKRLKYNGKIVQPVSDIVQWLSERFAKSDGSEFNRRSIEDLFKPSGTPPKNRLCDFDWLTFKDEIVLAKEAHEVKMKKY
jgi:hypothetical protein